MVLPWFLFGSESLFDAWMACFEDVLKKSEKG